VDLRIFLDDKKSRSIRIREASQNRPMTSPVATSISTSKNPGRVGKPGTVMMSPQIGYKKPANYKEQKQIVRRTSEEDSIIPNSQCCSNNKSSGNNTDNISFSIHHVITTQNDKHKLKVHVPPTQLRTSRTGTRKPVGAPFAAASQLKLYCVLAMQTGM